MPTHISRSVKKKNYSEASAILNQNDHSGSRDMFSARMQPVPIQRKCSYCGHDDIVQRERLASFIQKERSENSVAAEQIAIGIDSTKGSGKPLESSAKSFMESRFGASFSDVQIHTGGAAEQLSEALNANAFTTGNDIYFNTGKYSPETRSGKQLLAHELTHTIQQGVAPESVQKEEKDKTFAEKADIDFKVLPPDFQLRLFHFLLEADTSKVHLDFNTRTFMTGLSYQYGSALSFNMRFRDFSSKLGWEPGSNNLSLGMNYRGFSGSFGVNPEQQRLGLGIHYGAPLLPFSDQMGKTFTSGVGAFTHFASGLPAGLNNPLAYYEQNKGNIENISKTADLVKQITAAGKSKIRFGGDFSLTYDPVSKLVVTAKVGVLF